MQVPQLYQRLFQLTGVFGNQYVIRLYIKCNANAIMY
jgi:hypothetical protein